MKIDNIAFLNQAVQANRGQEGEKPAADAAKGADAGPAAVAHLSQAAAGGVADVDAARVQELREAIADGRLEMRADQVADSLLAQTQQMLEGD